MSTSPPVPESNNAIKQAHINCLLEEYRAMYRLVEFRMTSLDRRAPIAGATLTATLASVAAIPQESVFIILFGLPFALIWYLRTTINHARSFEDALRRIEQIEVEINTNLGKEIMRFQSRHPSRGRQVGGRTGRETVSAVVATVVVLLLGCAVMFTQTMITPWQGTVAYGGFLMAFLAHIGVILVKLRRYSYVPQ